MQRLHVLAEQRKHPRAPLRLPARVRWQHPLGMRLEVSETIDVSREGVLLRTREGFDAGISRAWIVFPFDGTDSTAAEAEIPARVVRVERRAAGDYRVGLQLEMPRRARGRFPAARERRTSPRVAVSLPVFVRTDGMPWPEDAMTRDFSAMGMKFETSRVYATGETVRTRIPWGEWAEAGEIFGRVVRVEGSEAGATAPSVRGSRSAVTAVAVEWTDPMPRASYTQEARQE
ncbi:MAG: PilZ domain-containing protein [Acidobacteriota bacterium]|nr:PilZ domain-containing protein [Acidobacteriota bacterium]MDE3170194.1 PilZ domain-containing protein [Acidobacteriota bacterium]